MDEVFCYILYLRLGAGLEIRPGFRSEFVDFWSFAFFGSEAGNFVQGVDVYENDISVLVGDFDYFVHPSVVIPHPHKSAEYSYSVVDMDYVIPYVERT